MQFITNNSGTNGRDTKIYYQEYGQGKPVVFIHGWPLNSDMWEYQLEPLSREGMRCIAYDRRGFGRSSKTTDTYTYDAMADDLHALLEELDLRDVTLVGFSMGGGEVARYLGKHGDNRIAGAVFVSSVTPYMLDTDSHDGVEWKVFQGMIDGIREDRPDFMSTFGKNFYGVSLLSHPVSSELLAWTKSLALQGSAKATIDCVTAFAKTDFRQDLAKIKVPTMVIHGTGDEIVPIKVAGDQTAEMVANARYHKYDGAPHALFYTHREKLNADLTAFVKNNVSTRHEVAVN